MTSQRGNFLYLDDVRVGNLTTAQSEILAAADFKVNLFPNPTSGESTIEIRNLKSSQVQISLTDLAGREIARSETAADASESLVQISSQKAFGKVTRGFYFIRVKNGVSEKVIRWIVQ
jgi:hypothetical protein